MTTVCCELNKQINKLHHAQWGWVNVTALHLAAPRSKEIKGMVLLGAEDEAVDCCGRACGGGRVPGGDPTAPFQARWGPSVSRKLDIRIVPRTCQNA